MDENYMKPQEASEKYGLSTRVLRKIANNGRVRHYVSDGGVHYYLESSLRKLFGIHKPQEDGVKERYLSPSDMHEKYGISKRQLRRLAREGKIDFYQLSPRGKRFYEEHSFRQHVGLGPENEDPTNVNIFQHRQFLPRE